MSSDVIRIVLADDHAAIRAGLRFILDRAPGLRVIAEASDGAEAIAAVRVHAPDVVLMDLRMPGVDGIDATRQIAAETGSRVLVLTTFDLDELVLSAVRAGAAGFLLKTAEPDELVAAIRDVAAGRGALSSEVTSTVLDALARPVPNAAAARHDPLRGAEHPRLAPLTPRELDVLRELGAGASNAVIAMRLVISEATVKTHVSSALRKLGCATRMQAAVIARETGLV